MPWPAARRAWRSTRCATGAAEGNGELYGLVRNDGSTRPAYRAYAVADTYFSGATSALYTWHADESAPSNAEIDALLASNAHRYQFVWPAAVNMVILQRPGQRVTVVWDAAPQPATAVIPVHGTAAVVVDKSGAVTPTTPGADGAYHLALEPSSNNSDPRDRTLYLTGGSPLILVEQVPAATATATTVPATATPTVAVPTATPTPTLAAPTATPAPFAPAQPVGPPAPNAHALYVGATRHTVSGPFLSFYKVHGVAIVGRPLTEPWTAGATTYQLFERLELSCRGGCLASTGRGRVAVEPLGLTLTRGRHFAPEKPLRRHPRSYRYVAATRHALSGDVAAFWAAHGGNAVLGPPISAVLHDRIPGAKAPLAVQYLRNARLELWPAAHGRHTVRVGLLGLLRLRSLLGGPHPQPPLPDAGEGAQPPPSMSPLAPSRESRLGRPFRRSEGPVPMGWA